MRHFAIFGLVASTVYGQYNPLLNRNNGVSERNFIEIPRKYNFSALSTNKTTKFSIKPTIFNNRNLSDYLFPLKHSIYLNLFLSFSFLFATVCHFITSFTNYSILPLFQTNFKNNHNHID